MRVVLLVEGDTETALKEHLRRFLAERANLENKQPLGLDTRQNVTDIKSKLVHRVRLELQKSDVLAVVGLVDVFPKYKDATDAKTQLRNAAGNHPQFYAHAAQYDVEAWLLPYWNDICRRLRVQRQSPGSDPEQVNGANPPAHRLQELYRLAKPKARKYAKVTEMRTLLANKDLTVAANQCPELKAFLNTLLNLGGLILLL